MAKRWASRKQLQVASGIIAGLTILGIVGFVLWFSFPVQATLPELQDAKSKLAVNFAEKQTTITLNPETPATRGLIFYPDAHISPAAYAHRLSAVAQRGIAIVIVKPILNYPLWDWQTVTDLAVNAPSVTSWFVGGHGAGGVKACQIAGSDQQVKGLLLMASSCANNISQLSLSVLSIAGANDNVVSQKDLQQDSAYLPANSKTQTIDGLNHAGFGNYGKINGDGELQIDDPTLQQKIADIVGEFAGIPSQ